MLKTRVLFFMMLAFLSQVYGQEQEKIVIKSGNDVSEVLSSYGMYRFPAFTDGLVTFRNSARATGKMNYNVYLGLIQFINSKGDTLAISNPETIDSAAVNNKIFYYRDGYCQEVEDYGNFKLVMKQQVRFTPVKLGALGLPANGTGAQTYESMSTPQVVNSKLSFNEDIIVVKKTIYLLFYKKYLQESATVKGFINLFPAFKERIQAFVKDNKINFSKQDDLKKIAAFCAGLPS